MIYRFYRRTIHKTRQMKMSKEQIVNSHTSSTGPEHTDGSSSLSLKLEKLLPFGKSPPNEEDCLKSLRELCNMVNLPLSEASMFRFACYHSFDFKRSKKAIRDNFFNNPFLSLRMEGSLVKQFEKNIFFPISGLMTRDGRSEVIYYKPSLLIPSASSHSVASMIENVCYVYNDLSRSEQQCRNGVVIVVDMEGYSRKNYSPEAARKVMAAIQGQVVPCRVSLFLLVNPPGIVKRLLKLSKPFISSSLWQKTKMLKKSEKLATFLMEDYERYLPLSLISQGPTSAEIVEDYIDGKMYDDKRNG